MKARLFTKYELKIIKQALEKDKERIWLKTIKKYYKDASREAKLRVLFV